MDTLAVVVAIAASVINLVALVLNYALITSKRFSFDDTPFNGGVPEMSRLLREQGRLVLLATFGAGLSLLAAVLVVVSS